MGGNISTEEWAQEYIDSMGQQLGSLFHLLVQECNVLHLEWADYRELFGTSQERIDLLNKAARTFFYRLNGTLWEMILLRIARLTADAPKSGTGKDNVTLRSLPELVNPAVKQEVENLLDSARTKCAFAGDWRNRRIAHRDLRLALKAGAIPLSEASRLSVTNALDSISAVLNAVEGHYMNGSSVAYLFIQSAFGAKALLYTLQEGVEACEARELRFRSGNLLPEDIGPRRII
jgi:hypothetical protein